LNSRISKYIKVAAFIVCMSLNSDARTVQRTRSQNLDKRFICQADVSDYSVELVVQEKDSSVNGVLTVWDDMDLLINNTEVDVSLDEVSEDSVGDFFDQFLMGRVNQHLKSR